MTIDLPKLALTIRQPWAHAIVMGWKDIENRTWPTSVRGHARAIEPIPLKGKQGFFEWRKHLAPDQRPADLPSTQGMLL